MRTLAQQYENVSIDDQWMQRGGSRPGRRVKKERLAEMYDALLFKDYFSDDPIFDDTDFREIYRMRKPLFCIYCMQSQSLKLISLKKWTLQGSWG